MGQAQLTAGQQQALSALNVWWRDPARMEARIDGIAGSGKTTLVGHFLKGFSDGFVVGVATTGRAAKMLRGKTHCHVMTIAQAFFRPVRISTPASTVLEDRLENDLRNGRVKRESPEHERRLVEVIAAEDVDYEEHLSEEVEEAELIIVDEHSMVSLKNRDVIRGAGKKTLLIGDPYQLPSPDFSSEEQNHPEYQEGRLAYYDLVPLCSLTEVVRTERNEAGSNICEAAAELRQGMMPRTGERPGVDARNDDMNRIVWDRQLLCTMFNADATIAGMHHARHSLTRAIRREAMGTDVASIGDGDKLLVTRNAPSLGLYNGDLLTAGVDIHLHAVVPPLVEGGRAYLHFWTDREDVRRARKRFIESQLRRVTGSLGGIKVPLPDRVELACATTMFEWVYEPYVRYSIVAKQADADNERLAYHIGARKLRVTVVHLEYGHVITCHKAQGSEFDRIVVVDDGWGSKNDPELTYRWRYTALTRARQHCLYLMTGRFAALSEIVVSLSKQPAMHADRARG